MFWTVSNQCDNIQASCQYRPAATYSIGMTSCVVTALKAADVQSLCTKRHVQQQSLLQSEAALVTMTSTSPLRACSQDGAHACMKTMHPHNGPTLPLPYKRVPTVTTRHGPSSNACQIKHNKSSMQVLSQCSPHSVTHCASQALVGADTATWPLRSTQLPKVACHMRHVTCHTLQANTRRL